MTAAKRKLFITGYGPFENYPINPSWEVAKNINAIPGWEIVKCQVQVDYEQVSMLSYPSNLDLIIHVGVGHKGPLKLEALAHNSPYVKPDVR